MGKNNHNVKSGRRVFIEDGVSFVRGTKTNVKPIVIKQSSKPVPKGIKRNKITSEK